MEADTSRKNLENRNSEDQIVRLEKEIDSLQKQKTGIVSLNESLNTEIEKVQTKTHDVSFTFAIH